MTDPDIAAHNDLALQFGTVALAILAGEHGVAAADAFATSIVTATLPGSPERTAQDAAWDRFKRRLIAASKGEVG